MGRKRRKEPKIEYNILEDKDYELLGKMGKLVVKPPYLYVRGRAKSFPGIRWLCNGFGIYEGFPERPQLEKMIRKFLVLVPADYVFGGTKFWLVHLVMDHVPTVWRTKLPVTKYEPCYRWENWFIRLCTDNHDAWILAGTYIALERCVMGVLVAHAVLHAGAEVLEKHVEPVVPLHVVKVHWPTRRIILEPPISWYYKLPRGREAKKYLELLKGNEQAQRRRQQS